MKTSEASMWASLSKLRKIYREDLHITRIENSVESGPPDVEGCFKSIQFWLELKSVSKPKREDTLIKPRFEENQIPWMRRRKKAGGRVFIFLQVGRLRYLIPAFNDSLKALERGIPFNKLHTLSIIPTNATLGAILMTCIGSRP